ncbi:MAG: ribokinase [Propionicimonas sp.]
MTTATDPAGRHGVLVVGSVNVDLTTFSERLPKPGETIIGQDFTVVLGGKGANQVVAAGLAGAPASMVACIGEDSFGELVSDGLSSAGVDLTHLRRVGPRTGIAHIRVDASGENNIVVVPLANDELDLPQIERALADCATTHAVLLTQLETPYRLTLRTLQLAREAGMTTILDPAPARELDPAIWPQVSVVTPNETEAELLTGIAVSDDQSAAAAGRWFIERGTACAVITRAGQGSTIVDAEGIHHVAAIPVTPVDTTAAGDAFSGYLGARLAAGDDLAAAVRVATAAGALTVTRAGASPSLPTAAEVEALLASAGA